MNDHGRSHEHLVFPVIGLLMVFTVHCSDRLPPASSDTGTTPAADGRQRTDGVSRTDGRTWPDGKARPDRGTKGNCAGGYPCPKGNTCFIKGCGAGAAGSCVMTPPSCTNVKNPVCGCDNKTYLNECQLVKVGVALKNTGACSGTKVDGGIVKPDIGKGKKCGPWLGGGCAKGQVCNLQSCKKGGGGFCVPKPVNCPTIKKPVCGCDNKTYANDCVRIKAGVGLNYAYACKTKLDGG